MSFLVVGYYTNDKIYSSYAKSFCNSMRKFNVPFHVEEIKSLGDWYLNVNFKPTFILRMMEKFPDDNIVYVDCDAKFCSYPYLFDDLNCNVAAHYFDRSNHPNVTEGFELLSGTLFFKNNELTFHIVNRWEKECKNHPYTWDQKSLEKILEGDFYNLPERYCTIFDIMSHVKDPVILHYQASRETRRKKKRTP